MSRLARAALASGLVCLAGVGVAAAQGPAAASIAAAVRRVEALAGRGRWSEARAAADSAALRLRAVRARGASGERTALALAVMLAVSGKPGEAAALYDTLLRAPGASEAAYVSAARFWTGTGRVELAAGVARRGIERYPRSGPLYLRLGEAEAARQHWSDAAGAYRRAAPLLARPEEAALPLLDALVAGHDTAAALALLRDPARSPAARSARLVEAALADSLGAAGVADTIYGSLLGADSLDPDALESAARLAERAGDTARAVALFKRADAVDSGGAEAPLALLRLARPGPDSARALLRRAAWHGMAGMERLDVAAVEAPSPGSASEPDARLMRERRRRAFASLETALDRAVLAEPWGPAELDQLRLAWPGSPLLERYAARLAERQGDAEGALAAVDGLLRTAPADAGLQRERGRLLATLGRPADAARAYARALDLEPEDDSTFRALQRLAESQGSLGDLLDQILRLRIRLPASSALAEHETEVRQRMGVAPAPRAPASPEGDERR